MPNDEDPLDLLEDDNDGVIETILLFDEEEGKHVKNRTGCVIPLIVFGLVAGGSAIGLIKFLV